MWGGQGGDRLHMVGSDVCGVGREGTAYINGG